VHKQLRLVENYGGVRFSLGPFNTDQEVAMAVEAVAQIAARARVPNRKPKRDVDVQMG
jgi:cysteine sulfinate desulfinase/cysteine desulfurase-like protein